MAVGWRALRLGDVCELKYGKSLPKAKRSGEGFAVFGSNGQIGRHKDALTSGETIIVGRKGSLGEVTFSYDRCWAIDTTYYIDESATTTDLRWLYYRMKAMPLTLLNRAAAVPGLNREDAYSQPLLLPPIEEQKRIADVLDAADALRSKRQLAIAKLDTLTQAFFIDMFGETSEWPTGRLGDHVPTTSGGTPSRSRPDFFDGRIPWVKSGELAAGRVMTSEETITEEALASSSAKLMPIGTVLLAMYGATVGEVAVLGVRAATNQAVCCISPTESVTGPFLVGLLRTRKSELVRRAAGGAQPNISQTIIRGLEVPLPPISIQEEYARRVATADELRESARSSEVGMEGLFASLQQRAFRGEL